MRFVTISDTHSYHKKLTLPKADCLIHAGDLSMAGKEHEIVDFLDWFVSQPFKYKIFIAGNHDFFYENNDRKVKLIHEIKLQPNVFYLNDSGCKIENINFWGSPITPWFFDWAFNRSRGTQIKHHWDLIPKETDILITHGPPHKILDVTPQFELVGCADLSDKIKELQKYYLKYHIFGHIHHSYGMIKEGKVTYINACSVNEDYKLVNEPIIFDFKK